MAAKIICETYFDITQTGVKAHFNAGRIPFTDADGTLVDTHQAWERSRNQQRNWETFNQIISLRTLPSAITCPIQVGNKWQFSFEVDDIVMVTNGDNPVGVLTMDAANVPMITELNEKIKIDPWIVVSGDKINTWFYINS